jgi:5-formyltetrahydrofolate cyclo-ligase
MTRLSLGSEELGPYATAAKKQLRAKLRRVRQALPESRWQSRNQVICSRLLAHPALAAPRGVALFWPMVERREVDLRPLDASLRERGIPIFYPFMERCEDGSHLTGFRLVGAVSELSLQGRGFAEPRASAPLARRGDVSVIIVPALAVTLDGYRLGYGAGFYDAHLLDLFPPAQSIVVAYDFQRMLELPSEPHDLRCDFVVTDA